MPSKGKRVASRQGNLRRRRNTANRSNAPASAGVGSTAVANPPSTSAADGSGAATATATAMAAGVAQAIGRPQTQPRGRRFDRPAAYNHVGSELVRIGIFAGVLMVALVAVSFVI